MSIVLRPFSGSTRVSLTNSYVSPVVVSSVHYANNTSPVVTRISSVTPTSFNVRLQDPSGGPVVTENLSYLVVEEGTWTLNGVKIEAQTYQSTVTDENGSWVGDALSYGQVWIPVTLAEELDTHLILTTDRRDFEVYRIRGRKRFEVLPRP